MRVRHQQGKLRHHTSHIDLIRHLEELIAWNICRLPNDQVLDRRDVSFDEHHCECDTPEGNQQSRGSSERGAYGVGRNGPKCVCFPSKNVCLSVFSLPNEMARIELNVATGELMPLHLIILYRNNAPHSFALLISIIKARKPGSIKFEIRFGHFLRFNEDEAGRKWRYQVNPNCTVYSIDRMDKVRG